MFRKNNKHEQGTFFTDLDMLPSMALKKLEKSWAAAFLNDYFSKIDENVFEVMYSKTKSRPNFPVNILLGIETLKSGFGLSDQVLYENVLFNLQFRYALGLNNLRDGYFDLKTLYNFRKAVREYEAENKVNLIEKAFEKVTDKQIEKFKIKTGLQRMDSTLVQSNIRNMGRLQLVVEFITRAHRLLSIEDKEKYGEIFDQYVKENSLHYCYRVKSDETVSRLEQIGLDIYKILELLKEDYNKKKEYQELSQMFSEHYSVEEKKVTARKNYELKGSNLQTPDDIDATYRKKGKDKAKGYVSNISETCDKENNIQLITKVSTDSNITDDQELYKNDIENINSRMDLETMVTDGGYIGEIADSASEKNNVDHQVTATKGKKSTKDKFGIDDFKVSKTRDGLYEKLTCPNNKEAPVTDGKKKGRYVAVFNSDNCSDCSFKDKCPAKKSKRSPIRTYRFTKREVRASEIRNKIKNMSKKERNIRASVESTVRSVIHPFGGHLCKLPVRGKFRIASMIILSAAMTNIRRIQKRNMELIQDKNNIVKIYFLKTRIFISNFKENLNYLFFALNSGAV